MDIVADESVDFGIVKTVRSRGFKVYSIAESNSGINDVDVLQIAIQQNSLLLTEDKDFGELTYRLQIEHKGILLIRLTGIERNMRIKLVEKVLSKHFNELINKFSVLKETGLRIKA